MVTMGVPYSRFFEGLKQKRIIGNVCPECRKLYVPPRPFCDDCFKIPSEWVETDGVGVIESFTVTYVKFLGLPEPPHITAIIKIGNSVTNLLHRVAGVPFQEPLGLHHKVKVGMKVKPVWADSRVGDINDIDYFEPV
jgi:hypothetical protein